MITILALWVGEALRMEVGVRAALIPGRDVFQLMTNVVQFTIILIRRITGHSNKAIA